MSLLGASPTLFIFKVSKPLINIPRLNNNSNYVLSLHQTNQQTRATGDLSRSSCRLVTPLAPKNFFAYDLKVLTWIYIIIPIVVYSMCLYWFLMNFTTYMHSIDPARRDSIFLTDLEDVCVFQVPTPAASSSDVSLMFLGRDMKSEVILNSQTVLKARQEIRDQLAAAFDLRTVEMCGFKPQKAGAQRKKVAEGHLAAMTLVRPGPLRVSEVQSRNTCLRGISSLTTLCCLAVI
ncbi:hypothetical protein PoB_002397700 [Plakobranchus ocellatus]|uniref:Uncharacterized protein n=1 Tax=Plakobranchus ocellatus TaxID=259542 RepID=A0AAV3ZQK6_9GAST|nr:hypothetical protein PoB_002397700 [Plakobranchus ocellatus]